VTETELQEIGLGHLIGTTLLRAYMHGYFMDMRLYRKAKSAAQPFQFDDFKNRKIREKLQEERANRVKFNTLPKVNKELALKLINSPLPSGKKKTGNILEDERFKDMFANPDFELDKSAEEYRLLNPVVSKLDKKKAKKLEALFTPVQEDEELEGVPSSEEESSSDDDRQLLREEKKQRKMKAKERDSNAEIKPKFYEIRQGEEFKHSDLSGQKVKVSKMSLGDRVRKEVDSSSVKSRGPLGSREMTFSLKTRKRDDRQQAREHHEERRKIRRSAGGLKSKKNAWKK